MSSPRILVTNDDGIHAPGLQLLEEIARELSEDVWVVAPETEQSGAAHSLSLHNPVRVRKLGDRRFAVTGTPTDCVLLAMQVIIPQRSKKLSLVLSGVNRGSNAGDDITYSGTIAAAMEGTLLGVPSIALSQDCSDFSAPRWDAAKVHGARVVTQLVKAGWPNNTLMNVNFPECTAKSVKGVRAVPHGKRKVGVVASERLDPKNRPYYWIGGEREDTPDRPGVDLALLAENYITVTPIGMDMTDYKTLETLRTLKIS